MGRKKIDTSIFLDMDKHQDFLNNLRECKNSAVKIIMFMEAIPYKGLFVRRQIKKWNKYKNNMAHDIAIEERWRVND
jgi:hypothetical protein